ncbi:MAG: ABC transporter permease [Bacteroidales bacterium]|nr:ABC transporter permease [Bacteroidales bacterium]
MIDLAKEIWQTMCTNKLRTILTGISVAWGIFMLILLLSISHGLLNHSMEFMASNDPNRISVWGGRTSKAYMGLKEGRDIPLRYKYMDAIKEDSKDNVEKVTSTIYLSGTVSTNKDYLSSSSVVGMYPGTLSARNKLLYGREINQADMQQQRKVIMLHKKSAAVLFDKPEEAVGKYVKLGNLAFTVVGIYDHDWEQTSIIPFTTAYALSGYSDQLQRIDVHIKGISNEQESAALEKEVRHSIAKSAIFDPDDESAVWTFDRFASYINNIRSTNYLNIAMWVIGLLTLITGIVGVSNIMFVSVKERTHEIGIRRAIGAKPRNLIVQVVLESIVLTTCFGYIGIVLGTVAVEIFSYATRDSRFFLNPTVDISIAIEVTIALIIAGALAGLFPAIRATKVRPVEALRDE